MSRRKGNHENLARARRALDKAGIRFTAHNDGHHLKLVEIGVDFWPSTCRYRINRKTYQQTFDGCMHAFRTMASTKADLYESRRTTSAIGGPCFPQPGDPPVPWEGEKFHYYTPEQAKNFAAYLFANRA